MAVFITQLVPSYVKVTTAPARQDVSVLVLAAVVPYCIIGFALVPLMLKVGLATLLLLVNLTWTVIP
jgi:hypothetical protein